MKIEIVTTKKKLYKSIIGQMRHATLEVLIQGLPLGFVINVVKNCHKAILIQHENNYYKIPANYTKGELSVYRKIGKWSSSIQFETSGACDFWWKAYQQVIEHPSTVNQIYI